MPYQDKWISGKVSQAGYRECEIRYAIIKAFCDNFKRPFTVCDIGSNWNYFGLRLTHDFPECSVVAFEYRNYELRVKHLKQAKAQRILLFGNKLHLADFHLLGACCHFDVVLALSVIHHLDGSFPDRLAALRGLGANLIAEFAIDDSPRVTAQSDYRVPDDGVILGYGESHKARGIQRPIMLLEGVKR